MGRLIVVTGVGTGVGKTWLAVSLLRAGRGRLARVAGFKPIESGVAECGAADARALAEASTFHVKPSPLYGFDEAVSPHLAAARSGRAIERGLVVAAVTEAQGSTDLLVVELAGGLFTPISNHEDNADLVASLAPDHTIVVAVDRLGVLHSARATALAADYRGLPGLHLALVAPDEGDASTGTNATALADLYASVHAVPRVGHDDAGCPTAVERLLSRCLGERFT